MTARDFARRLFVTFPLLMIVAVACSRTPSITSVVNPHNLSDEQQRQLRTTAPLVLVVRVLNDVPVAKQVSYLDDPSIRIRLHRVDVQIENVLRGKIPLGKHAIFYFHWDSQVAGNRLLGSWQAKGRYILYVKPESRVLRMVSDFWEVPPAMPIYSGSHLNYEPSSGDSLEKNIAHILLTKGSGVSDEMFVKSFDVVGDWLGPYGFEGLLKLSAQSTSESVRVHACDALKSWDKPCK